MDQDMAQVSYWASKTSASSAAAASTVSAAEALKAMSMSAAKAQYSQAAAPNPVPALGKYNARFVCRILEWTTY